MFVPDNIDELSEGIVKKNLVPSKQDVEEKGKIEEEDYDPEKVKGKEAPENAKQAEEEEVDLEEVAKMVGTTKEALEKFIESEGITDKNKIKGVKPVTDIDGLESLLNQKLPEQNSTVLVLKIEGELHQDKGYVIDTNGNKLLGNEGNVNKVAEELVPEHSCSEAINNMSEAKNTEGQKIDKVAYLKNKKEYLKQKRDMKLQELNSGKHSGSEFHTASAEIAYEYKKDLEELGLEADSFGMDLSQETQEVANEISEETNSAEKEEGHEYTEAGKAEVAEIAVDTGKTIATVAGGAVATGAAIAGVATGVKKITDNNDRDPREKQGNSHEDGRMPFWMQE